MGKSDMLIYYNLQNAHYMSQREDRDILIFYNPHSQKCVLVDEEYRHSMLSSGMILKAIAYANGSIKILGRK
jgi:hypothetical protein